ncbi:MAG TPA: hypothetical protein VGI11_00845, partial [Variovorax sp.]
LFEGVVVQQQLDALARRQLALGMLGVDALLPASQPRLGAAHFQLFEDFFHEVPWEELMLFGEKEGC